MAASRNIVWLFMLQFYAICSSDTSSCNSGSLLQLSRKASHDDGKANVQIPNIVIVGLGDSGTRGVKTLLEGLGVRFCADTNDSEDDTNMENSVVKYALRMITSTSGNFTSMQASTESPYFIEAVHALKQGAAADWQCIQDANPNLQDTFAWGYKNPKQLYLIPVMESLFARKQHMLGVVRDPRDNCRERPLAINSLVFGDELMHAVNTSFIQLPIKADCYKFWATVWHQVLNTYDDADNFKIVRIESLVMPDPVSDTSSQEVLSCVASHAGVQPIQELSIARLQIMHSHRDAYMGQKIGFAERSKMEKELATRTDDPRIHEVMLELGYHTDHYELLKPQSTCVC